MKKIILLLTMVCATGQLYGMENTNLSQEAQVQVFKTLMQQLKKSKNLVQFTRLMNRLSEKFPHVIREKVATKIGTPLAQKYINLNKSLAEALLINNPDLRLSTVKTLVNRGADVNFTFKFGESIGSILGTAYNMVMTSKGEGEELVQFLLDKGATTNVRYGDTTLIEHISNKIQSRI